MNIMTQNTASYISNLKYQLLLAFLVIITFASSSQAQQLSANQIIDKANLAAYYAGDDGSAQARMIIVDENGNKQMRQFTILRQDEKDLGNQKIGRAHV